MKKIKGWIPGALLLALIFGSTVTNTNAGIIFGAAEAEAQSCTEPEVDRGIIFGLMDGIIFGVGIIFGATENDVKKDAEPCSTPTDKGIIFG